MELGDGTTVAEAADSHTMARAFPHTLGQPLAHFLRETAQVPDAHIITELPSVRCVNLFALYLYVSGLAFVFDLSSIQLKLVLFLL